MTRSVCFLAPLALALAVCAAGSGSAWAQGSAATTAAQLPAQAAPAAADLPIRGLAQITIKVSDLARSRAYYGKVLGLPEAFQLKDRSGKVNAVYFKVNDEQFIEIVPGLQPDDLVRTSRLVIQAADLKKLRGIYVERGVNPSAIKTGADGNPTFRVVLPNGFPIDFLQYAPTSRQGRLRGKLLTSDRISTHLLHAGTMVTDDATKAFWPKLGLNGRPLPGGRGDYLETPASDRNLETKNPPLDPNNPATKAQYTREVYGAVYHFSLEIEDMHAARETLKRRGGFDDVRLRTAVGNNRHWLLHLFDPDGTRAELMSKDEVPADVPAFSVMPPGPVAPPILAKERGVYPWPTVAVAQQAPPAAGAGSAPGPAAARPPRYVEPTPYDFEAHEGWISMFDGKSLAGWDGPPGVWRVEEGAIVTSDRASNPTPNGSVYLVWKGRDGGDLKDFEFKTEIKLEGERANSGVQFRAMMLGKTEKKNSEWESFGYQADMDYANVQTGALIECCSGPRRGPSPRPFKASMGQSLRVAPTADGKPNLLGAIGDAESLKKTINVGGWNQLHIVARGHTMFYYLNGRLMSTIVDDDPARFMSHGRLLIQLEGGGDKKVSYRNMWLKTYP